MLVHTFQWTSSEFFLFQILYQKISKPIKTNEKDHSFYNSVSLSKNLTHFVNLNSFEIENNMLPKHSQKIFSVYKFSSKNVFVWCQKKRLHCTNSLRPRTIFSKHFESKCLYISANPSKKMFVTKT